MKRSLRSSLLLLVVVCGLTQVGCSARLLGAAVVGVVVGAAVVAATDDHHHHDHDDCDCDGCRHRSREVHVHHHYDAAEYDVVYVEE